MADDVKSTQSVADPAPLGLGAFALTTFLLSAHNSFGGSTTPLLAFYGFAIFYGGLAQFMAGMFEFRNRNPFGATAFSTYGAFWMGLAAFVSLVVLGKVNATEVAPSLGWILLAFAIFNTYMLLWSTRINAAVFAVFLTLEVTEVLLFLGNFLGEGAGTGFVALGGYVGILTACVAWYTSAALLINGMAGRAILSVGRPLWSERTGSQQLRPAQAHA
jgi:succinate-acetate transporter protein